MLKYWAKHDEALYTVSESLWNKTLVNQIYLGL